MGVGRAGVLAVGEKWLYSAQVGKVTPTGHANVWMAGGESLRERALSFLGLSDHLGDLTEMRKTIGRRGGGWRKAGVAGGSWGGGLGSPDWGSARGKG